MNATKLCSIDGCDNEHLARGWCGKHYRRWQKHGDPNHVRQTRYSDPEESFKARTEWQGDCLIWTGTITKSGYGHISFDGKHFRAHRYAWERVNGPIPDGKHIDHICHNKACVNVAHLRLATVRQNLSNRSGATKGNIRSGIRNIKKHGNGWQVRVGKNGKQYHFGTYQDIEEAAEVAEQARKELFGEYAGRG